MTMQSNAGATGSTPSVTASSTTASPSMTSNDGMKLVTKSGGGSGDALFIVDSSTNTGKSIRMDGTNPATLQILNNAFSAILFQIDDSGNTATKNQLSPSNFGTLQTANSLWIGSGAPANGNGANGDIYFRTDGGSGTTIYQRRSGVWVATGA